MCNLSNSTKFTSIDITWSSPRSPNGIVLHYEFTYTVTISHYVSVPVTKNTNLSTNFTITRLTPGTRVSVSVRAYTSVGPGEDSTLNLVILEPCE